MKKLLCKIGLHNWKEGWVNSILTPAAEKCSRCETVRVFNFWGYVYYEKGEYEDYSAPVKQEEKVCKVKVNCICD